jgi:hypothetical protein
MADSKQQAAEKLLEFLEMNINVIRGALANPPVMPQKKRALEELEHLYDNWERATRRKGRRHRPPEPALPRPGDRDPRHGASEGLSGLLKPLDLGDDPSPMVHRLHPSKLPDVVHCALRHA